MGKVLITNNIEWKKNLDTIFTSMGLKKNYFLNDVIIYRKQYLNNKNCYINGNNMVGCVGTWAYLGLTQNDGLKLLYEDAVIRNLSVEEIRKNLVGSYCCIIQNDKRKKIFVDETHTYAIYYYISDDYYILTNTFYHIQKTTKQKINEKVFKIVCAKKGLSSNQTIFNNIRRLWEDEYLQIDEKGAVVKKCDLNTKKYSFNSYQECLDVLQKEILKYSHILNGNVHKKMLFATGGADSRLKLALDLKDRKTVSLAYWSGNNVITNGTKEDRKINNCLAKKCGVDTHFFDVSEELEYSLDNIKNSMEFLGEYCTIYANNSKWLKMVDRIHEIDLEIDEIELGYDPDVLREVGTIEASYKKPYTIEDLIESSYLRSGLFKRVFEMGNVAELIEEELSSTGIYKKDESLTIEAAVNLFNYCRLDMGSILMNFFNQYYYCTNLIYIKPLWDITQSIPYEYKKNSRLEIDLIYNLNKELLEVPIYSQNHYMIIDWKNKCLKKTMRHSVLSWLKPRVMRLKIYDILYVKFVEKMIFPETYSSDKLMQICLEKLKDSTFLRDNMKINLRVDISRKGFDMAALGSLVAYIQFAIFCIFENGTGKNGK